MIAVQCDESNTKETRCSSKLQKKKWTCELKKF